MAVEVAPCPSCSRGQMQEGRLGPSTPRWFPLRQSIWKDESRPITAAACDQCGFVALKVQVAGKADP